MKKYIVLVLGSLFFILLCSEFSFSQCAMCRATVENNQSANQTNTIGNGLNQGILYLLSVPYLILATFGVWWYRHFKKEARSKK